MTLTSTPAYTRAVTCQRCGGSVRRRPGPGRDPHWCEACRPAGTATRAHAKVESDGVVRLTACSVCGRSMAPRKGKVFCGPSCDQAARRQRRGPRVAARHVFACANCGTETIRQGPGRRRYCGRVCMVRAADRRRRGLINDRRGTHIGLHQLGERDGWRCGICHRAIDRDAPRRTAASPSMDHIIPLARGGLHTDENLQIAHYGCNVAKRDRLVAA